MGSFKTVSDSGGAKHFQLAGDRVSDEARAEKEV